MPRKTDSNNPSDWLWIAESELEGIRILAERQSSYAMCQSKLAEVVEKIMKAELIRTGWRLEKTHDLERLLGELTARKNDLAASFEPLCESLAEVYFSGRYPGFDFDEPDWSGLQGKLTVAGKLLETVNARIASSVSPSVSPTGKT